MYSTAHIQVYNLCNFFVCYLILFEALVKICTPHATERSTHEGLVQLVHASLDRVWESSRVSLRKVKIELTNRALAGLDTQYDQ